MSIEELEEQICELVKKSLEDKQYEEKIEVLLSEKTVTLVWKLYFIDLKKYRFHIHSNEIRHIYNEHQEEVWHICKIPYYLEKFKHIEKTTTRDAQTGKQIPCLTFTKQLNDKKVKFAKMNLSRKKVLKLKTMYEV
jgi:hypothetical protein